MTGSGELVRDLLSLPPGQVLVRLLELDDAREIVQRLPCQDFFWLVKKIGEEDIVHLLRLASEEQWQHVIDLEIWMKDRLHMRQMTSWLDRLHQADARRLARWLLSEGEYLCSYYLFKNIEVVLKSEEEEFEPPEGYFSQDGVFYVRARVARLRDHVEGLVRAMAGEDLERYQALLLELTGVLPAQLEEEMYRLRSLRLAEHGFLPFEEALSVYAPLDPEALNMDGPHQPQEVLFDEGALEPVPVCHLLHSGADNTLTETTSAITDPFLLDRIRLEFAGLCNQIQSADGLLIPELEILIKTCRKASGYVNVALERLCGEDIALAERLLRNNPLISLFRMGFGLAMELKWEAEQWTKGSWFHARGLDTGLWGEPWGETLAGLMKKRPLFYAGGHAGEGFRDFQRLAELDECRGILHRLMVLDALLKRLADLYPMDEGLMQMEGLTFHPLLFDLWARRLLKMEPGFSGIPLAQAKDLFDRLRAGCKGPPYRMPGFQETFVKDFLACAPGLEPEDAEILEGALSLIWREFQEEYEWVSRDDLEPRYSKCIRITTTRHGVGEGE